MSKSTIAIIIYIIGLIFGALVLDLWSSETSPKAFIGIIWTIIFLNLILTDQIGYQQFYTQLLFDRNNPIIKIKTLINNEEATSKISTCKKIKIFDKES